MEYTSNQNNGNTQQSWYTCLLVREASGTKQEKKKYNVVILVTQEVNLYIKFSIMACKQDSTCDVRFLSVSLYLFPIVQIKLSAVVFMEFRSCSNFLLPEEVHRFERHSSSSQVIYHCLKREDFPCLCHLPQGFAHSKQVHGESISKTLYIYNSVSTRRINTTSFLRQSIIYQC